MMKDERMGKVLLRETDEREVSRQLPLKLVDSPALFVPQTVLNNPFLTVLTHFSPHLIGKLCQKNNDMHLYNIYQTEFLKCFTV